jgi:hypothetical protein
VQVRGFDEDHGSILTSRAVIERLTAILAERRHRDLQGPLKP